MRTRKTVDPSAPVPGLGVEVTVPRISVVICAYTEERWEQILAAVDSIRGQSLASEEIIVVVDHNEDLRARLAAALPDVTVVGNREVPGLSGAGNTGVTQTRGDVVAFLDDDAIAEHDWLKFFADSYTDPAVAGVGGLVLPRWETRRPAWFAEEFDWVVGCSYVGMPCPGACPQPDGKRRVVQARCL